ncbi:LacI family DNA-binding transcriptional regulator [Anaerobacillus sp. MEB173]|uniref:LacI family DNA-binding transcriptional regulator n=1 Tax=Anaerobacillus sp. MEB173 TaxID=3383345 RepID=UPI003F8EA17C
MVTVKEIAKLAGVSTATVSRVLNNSGGYSEETKQRIVELLDKHNYQMNVVAKSLRTSHSKTIGIIVPDITNEYFATIALAIENYFYPNGYSIYIYNTSEDPKKESLIIRDLESRGVDGLIYISGTMTVPKQVLKKNLPIVCINQREYMTDEFTVVESDNFQGGFIATEELIKQGCRRIVLLRDKRDIVPMNERLQGYREALIKYDIPFDSELVQHITFDAEHAAKCVRSLIQRKISFDGIFACNDLVAMGALYGLRENKIQVGNEVKVVGFDNISIGHYSYPTLTTINQQKEELGEKASEILLQFIEKKEKPSQSKIVLPVTLVKRETT